MENPDVGKTEVAATAQDAIQDPSAEVVISYLDLVNSDEKIDAIGCKSLGHDITIFKNIKVWGGNTQLLYQATVVSIFWFVQAIYALFSHRSTEKRLIINGIDGVLREGEMLLVLGRPGSGCTTLLKTLAGMTESFHAWAGSIFYFGIGIESIKKRFRGDVVYNAEGDVHIPFLTVQQTLGFAVETKTSRKGLSRQQRHSTLKSITAALVKVFGLEKTVSTLVGNEFVGGVSGGERKRVSLAEVLSTNAKITLWDNSTQGLDATTSLRFSKSLQTYSKTGKNIVIAAFYQASDDLVNVFDKITILHQGHQIFFGTKNEALEYFTSMGFQWGKRQSLSDFLVSVTDPDLCERKMGWEERVPRSVDDFLRCWRGSRYYRTLQKDLDDHIGLDSSENGGKVSGLRGGVTSNKGSTGTNSYVLTWGAQLAVTMGRALQRLKGDKKFIIASIMMPIFVSLVVGSAFYNTPDNTTGFFSRQGVLFFSILFNAIQTLGEVGQQYSQRPIVQKQASFAMYHPGIDALSSLISLWPVKLVTITIFNVVLYFMANLKREVGAFFTFFLFTFTTILLMCALFRFIAAINKHESNAIAIAGILILPLVIYTGYVIPPVSMHPWFKWISYINPMAYAFESLMANEFHNRQVPCAHMIPSGSFYSSITPKNQACPVTGSTPGSNIVSGDRYIELSFNYYYSHLWRNYGILITFFIFFVIAYALTVEFVPQVEKGRGDVLIYLRKGLNHPRKTTRNEELAVEGNGGNAANSTGMEIPTENENGFAKLERSKDSFTWNHLNYSIPIQNEIIPLLTDIDGYIKPGTMTALLGQSGAGKTTLLNVLSQRTNTGLVKGDILINGIKLPPDFARRTGYVESQDVHLSQFTVRETLKFSAQLRQNKGVGIKEKMDYVEEIIDVLGMRQFADAVVGTPGSGLSLEQRKKMTIGVELVAKPSLLFLDEPTSGLDSQSSWSIIQTLRKLANSGQAILCTIHQPSAVLFEQFDRVLLLQKGGRCVYFGDIGMGSRRILAYLEGNGAEICGGKRNPAEYILQVTETETEAIPWASTWLNSPEFQKIEHEITSLSTPPPQPPSTSTATSPPLTPTPTPASPSLWNQYTRLQRRTLLFYYRSPVYIRSKLILNVGAGLFLGFTFYKEQNTVQGVQNKMFAVFASCVISAPLMNQLQPHFLALKSLFEAREEPAKMYHWSIFILCTAITEMITNTITGTLYFLPWYWAVGFGIGLDGGAGKGVYMWLIFTTFQLWLSTFGQLLAALAPTPQTAFLLIPATFVFVALFCGVLQPLSQLPLFWHWVHYLSPLTYLVEGMFTNILTGVQIHCKPTEINILQPLEGMTCKQYLGLWMATAGGSVANPDATSACQYCRLGDGSEYLGALSMSWSHRWRNYGFMFIYIIFNFSALALRFWIRGKGRKTTGKMTKKV